MSNNPELEEPSALLSDLDAALPSVHMGDTLRVEFAPTMERLTSFSSVAALTRPLNLDRSLNSGK